MAIGQISPRKALYEITRNVIGRVSHLPYNTPMTITMLSATPADTISRTAYSELPLFLKDTYLRLVTPLEVKAQIRIKRLWDGSYEYLLADYQDENQNIEYDVAKNWGEIWCYEIEIEAVAKVDLTADRTTILYVGGGKGYAGKI